MKAIKIDYSKAKCFEREYEDDEETEYVSSLDRSLIELQILFNIQYKQRSVSEDIQSIASFASLN